MHDQESGTSRRGARDEMIRRQREAFAARTQRAFHRRLSTEDWDGCDELYEVDDYAEEWTPGFLSRLHGFLSPRRGFLSPLRGFPDRLPRFAGRLRSTPWPLFLALIAQTILSGRLLASNSAFVDEATYVYAGHQEIHTLLTQATFTVPGQNGYYQSYFSGAPIIYPVLGALADHFGGIVTARLLSLTFMLGATTLLYFTAARIFTTQAAAAGAMLFAIVAPTQFLGALATYDAMAVFLMALAAFLAVRAAQSSDNSISLPLAAAVMVLADATKYATILFDPIIIGLAVFVSLPHRDWHKAFRQGYRMLAYSATLAAALLAAGGGTYVHGLTASTLGHTPGHTSSKLILTDSWRWVGIIALAAGAAVVVYALSEHRVISEHRGKLITITLLAAAILLVPLEQARIHTSDSLQKHVDFGAWFASIAAGYLLSRLVPWPKKLVPSARKLVPGATRIVGVAAAISLAAVAALLAIRLTIPEANSLYSWPNSSREVASLRPWAEHSRVLAEDYFIYSYYLGHEVPRQRWANTWHLDYVDPSTGRTVTGLQAYRDAIAHHYFGTVAISYGTTGQLDEQIVVAIKNAGGYRRVVHIRYGKRWFDVFHDMRER